MKSFQNKKGLRFIITLGTGKFGSSDNNRITLEGYRAIVDIDKAGGVQMSTLRARIYGLTMSDINSITTLRWNIDMQIVNTIEVFALDGPVESLVFAGNLVNAVGNYQNQPDVFLQIQAQAAYFDQTNSVPPKSFQGGIDVATVMAQLARDMGRQFENNGVSIQLTDVYLANSGLEQVKELAHMAGIDYYIDDNIIAITPANVPRASLAPVISRETGLVGYPALDALGVAVTVLFNPSIIFGGTIVIETELKHAQGEWVVISLAHRLESERPGGSWFSTVRGNKNGLAITK